MPEITIKYEKPETLKILKAFAKYLDFRILSPNRKKRIEIPKKGATIIPADLSVDDSEMEAIFSGRNLDASELRKKAWQRN